MFYFKFIKVTAPYLIYIYIYKPLIYQHVFKKSEHNFNNLLKIISPLHSNLICIAYLIMTLKDVSGLMYVMQNKGKNQQLTFQSFSHRVIIWLQIWNIVHQLYRPQLWDFYDVFFLTGDYMHLFYRKEQIDILQNMFHRGKKVTCLDHGHDVELHFHTVPCKSARSVELKGLFTSITDSLILANYGMYYSTGFY